MKHIKLGQQIQILLVKIHTINLYRHMQQIQILLVKIHTVNLSKHKQIQILLIKNSHNKLVQIYIPH